MLLFAVLCFGILTLWVPARWALTLFQLALFCLAAIRIPEWIGWRSRPSPSRTDWPLDPLDPAAQTAYLLSAALLWGLLQWRFGWTVDAYLTQRELLNWTANLCGLMLGAQLAKQNESGRFLDAVLIFSVAIAILGALTAISSPPGVIAWSYDLGVGPPTYGPFVYRNQFAAFAEVGFAITLAGALTRPNRGWYLASAAILFGAVVVSGSRGGSVMLVAELLLIPTVALWQSRISPRLWAKFLGISVTSLAAAVAVAGPGHLLGRLTEADPYALRADLVRSSWTMFLDRPWTGFGLGTWAEVYPGYALYDAGLYVNQAHNDWVQWAVEGGAVFACLLLVVFLRMLPLASKSLWGPGLLAVAVHAVFDYPFQQRPALSVFLFIIMGIVISQKDTRPNQAASFQRPSLS